MLLICYDVCVRATRQYDKVVVKTEWIGPKALDLFLATFLLCEVCFRYCKKSRDDKLFDTVVRGEHISVLNFFTPLK